MTRGRLPYFRLYAADLLDVLGGVPLQAAGLFMRLACRQWLLGSLPADLGELARIARVPAGQFRAAWPHIEHEFPVSSAGVRLNPELAEQREAALSKAGQARAAADTRWGKSRSSNDRAHADAERSESGRNASRSGAGTGAEHEHEQEQEQRHPSATSGGGASGAGTRRAALLDRLPGAGPTRAAVAEFLEACPAGTTTGWVATLQACLDGLDMPEGRPCSPDRLATVCRDFRTKSAADWNPRFFRACLLTPEPGSRRPSGGAGATERTIQAAAQFAEERTS